MFELSALLTFILAPAPLLFLFYKKKIDLNQDFIFLVFYSQVFIYIHLAPTINMLHIDKQLQEMYLFTQAMAWLFFELPLIIFYRRIYPKLESIKNRNNHITLPRQANGRIIFFMFLLGFALAFLYLSFEYDLFFRRIGHEGLALRSSQMSFLELVVYRTYSETSVFLLMISILLCLNLKKSDGISTLLPITSTLIHASIYGSFVLLNNRLQTDVLILLIFLIFSLWKTPILKIPIYPARNLLALCLVLLISTKVVSDVRTLYAETGGFKNYSVSELFSTSITANNSSLIRRLDGIELMATITKPALSNGFLWGDAWTSSIAIYYYMVTDPEKARTIKKELKTNPKVYIAEQYLQSNIADSPSSMLTDIYGNFFIFGFIPCAFFLASGLGFVSKQMLQPTSSIALYTALYLLPFFFKFEKEFLTLCLNILKFSPALLLVIAIKPFKLLPANQATSNQQSQTR
jgi:hypothetical protein